jgi:hypothetical protein
MPDLHRAIDGGGGEAPPAGPAHSTAGTTSAGLAPESAGPVSA